MYCFLSLFTGKHSILNILLIPSIFLQYINILSCIIINFKFTDWGNNMFIATHKKIAVSAYNMLNPEMKLLINKKAFIDGSYYPDFNFKYTVINHDYESTIEIIQNKINKILSKRQKKKELSKKLGIICHFIADYCSPFHTNERYKNQSIIAHLNYENKTNKQINQVELTDIETKTQYIHGLNSISADLYGFIKTHMQGEKNMEKEIKLAVLNSYHIICLIMTNYINLHVNNDTIIDSLPFAPFYPPKDAAAIYSNLE